MGITELRFGATRVIFTDRHGGVSKAPYDTLNLGLLTGDDPESVLENRRRVGERLGGAAADPADWFRIRQVHGARVLTATGASNGPAPEADAAVTAVRGLPLLVLAADCAPVALATRTAVGVVHAGWRGLLAGVVEGAVAALRRLDPSPVRAALGPCIRPEHYEFGEADLSALEARLGPRARGRTHAGAPALDLPAAVRAALGRAGVTDLTDVGVCTAASPDHFSYRRDGETGRQAAVVLRES